MRFAPAGSRIRQPTSSITMAQVPVGGDPDACADARLPAGGGQTCGRVGRGKDALREMPWSRYVHRPTLLRHLSDFAGP